MKIFNPLMKRAKFLRRRHPTEANNLRAIMDWLDAHNYLWVRHSPSNVVGKKGQATFRRVRPSQLGAPDILVWTVRQQAYAACETIAWAIEVKSPSGKLSEQQESWRSFAESVGVRYIVARRLEHVSEAIQSSYRMKDKNVFVSQKS